MIKFCQLEIIFKKIFYSMSIDDPTVIFYYIGRSLAWVGSWMWEFKLASFLISIVLIVLIARYVIKMNYFDELMKYNFLKYIDHNKTYKEDVEKIWDTILKKVQTNDANLWAKAIMMADELLIDVLRRAGYKGFNADQVLSGVGEENIHNIKELKSERIDILSKINSLGKLDIKEIKKLLRLYRNVLRILGMLS